MTAYCEAGGSTASFWRETPRSARCVIVGYRRRRGWHAWHVATLSRFDFDDGFPALSRMMGIEETVQADPAVKMAHNLRLWRAVLGQAGSRQDDGA